MSSATAKKYLKTPKGKYSTQIKHTLSRGLEWNLSFDEWWKIWQDSGHWEERGRGKGKYCMGRKNDKGGYAVDNVYITSNEQNALDQDLGRDSMLVLQARGRKFDLKKPRMDLIPVDPIFKLGELYAIGAEKYGERNWEEGLNWSRMYAAAYRHLLSWWKGEITDPEDKQHHLIAAIWNCIALYEYERRSIGINDKPKVKSLNQE